MAKVDYTKQTTTVEWDDIGYRQLIGMLCNIIDTAGKEVTDAFIETQMTQLGTEIKTFNVVFKEGIPPNNGFKIVLPKCLCKRQADQICKSLEDKLKEPAQSIIQTA